jgi:predicted GNAT family acetyltransferase
VENDEENARELQSLYQSSKLKYPTLRIGTKRLRNPSIKNLEKWLDKMTPEPSSDTSTLIHDENRRQFRMPIENGIGAVRYERRDNTLFLIHAEVPFELRGQGHGKVLVVKTLEYIERKSWKAEAVCPYIKAVVRRSEKWSKLVAY